MGRWLGGSLDVGEGRVEEVKAGLVLAAEDFAVDVLDALLPLFVLFLNF